jgi:hypothetical protein
MFGEKKLSSTEPCKNVTGQKSKCSIMVNS